MSLNQNMITLSNTVKTLVYGDCNSICITNIDSSAIVYLGTSYVTSTLYGSKLTPGQSITLNNIAGDIYAISSVNNSVISILVSR